MLKNPIIKIGVATIVGEILLILLTTVAQEVVVDGLYVEHSSILDLLIGGSATLIAGIISGFVAAQIATKSNVPQCLISILIVIETTYLILAQKTENPEWFDIVSAVSLILSVWIGYFLARLKIL